MDIVSFLKRRYRLMSECRLGRYRCECPSFWKACVKCLVTAVVVLMLCEYAVYPIVISRCSWPKLIRKHDNFKENETLRAMFLADTHLLGPYRGHWFDKLRREWQMHRAFQTAVNLFRPEVIFFLGDVFDEGKWVNAGEWSNYVERFNYLFSISRSENTKIIVVAGNHDMGFHYEIDPNMHYRFNKDFKTSSVRLLKLKGTKFLLLNSMAMQMDECFLCKPAILSLRKISKTLRCEETPDSCVYRNKTSNQVSNSHSMYSPPILLQHFPMYRPSDELCTGEDTAENKTLLFKEKYDCLSKESSQLIFNLIRPRLVLSGHTHDHCIMNHTTKEGSLPVLEYSIPSFSWRNRNDPSFYLAIITPVEHHLSKCYLPKETTVINLYITAALILSAWLFGADRLIMPLMLFPFKKIYSLYLYNSKRENHKPHNI